MVKKMLGVADIAAKFGVEPKTVSAWRLRYDDFPEPDVQVGETAGWDPGRGEEIRVWMGRRPGRGRKTVPGAARSGGTAPDLRLQLHASG